MIQVLTTTGARPVAFDLCVRWMQRQTYAGAVRWIIVDDGPEPLVAPSMPVCVRSGLPGNWSVDVLRARPAWAPGQNTQARNLRAGLAAVDPALPLVIVEDDDWYAADWLETCAAGLRMAELFGEARTPYYHVGQRRGRLMGNADRASLCSTALRGRALAALSSIVSRHDQHIDIWLWAHPGVSRAVVPPKRVVGIKGLPGRAGIGIGHRPTGWTPDPELELLRGWIGDDAEAYACFRS